MAIQFFSWVEAARFLVRNSQANCLEWPGYIYPYKTNKMIPFGKTLALRLKQRLFCQKGRSLFKDFTMIMRVIRFMHELLRPQIWQLHALPKIQKIWELNHKMLEEKNVIGFQGSRMPLSIKRWWGFWSWLQTNQRRFFFSSIIRMALIKNGPFWCLTILRVNLHPWHVFKKTSEGKVPLRSSDTNMTTDIAKDGIRLWI